MITDGNLANLEAWTDREIVELYTAASKECKRRELTMIDPLNVLKVATGTLIDVAGDLSEGGDVRARAASVLLDLACSQLGKVSK